MVVVCESCSTRFRIDDARIPAKGRLVRCSQCKATFIAKPANASFDDTIREVVDEVTAAGGAPVPEPAADLFDAGGEDLSDRGLQSRSGSDDERWEFDETPCASALEAESRESSTEFFEADEPAAPSDEVGEPEEWDLLRESVEPAAREARFVEPARPAREPVVEPAPERFLDPVVPEPALRRPARVESGRSIGQLAHLAITTTAWVALVAMVCVGVLPLLAGGAGLQRARPAPRSFALADGEARDVRAVFVENAFAGTLLEVEGELARPHADPLLGLRVHLVDVNGARVGEGAFAGVARPLEELRDRAPGALRGEIEASAPAAALGGRFVAVFEAVPREATGLELALERLPLAPPTTTGAVEGQAAPTSAPAAAGEPTASSLPSPRPSSG